MHCSKTVEVQMIPVHIGHPLDYSNFFNVALYHKLQILSLCHSYLLTIAITLHYFH